MWEQALRLTLKHLSFLPSRKANLQFKRRLELGETSTKQFGKVAKSGVKMHCLNFGIEGDNKKTCRQRVPKLEVNGNTCLFFVISMSLVIFNPFF